MDSVKLEISKYTAENIGKNLSPCQSICCVIMNGITDNDQEAAKFIESFQTIK